MFGQGARAGRLVARLLVSGLPLLWAGCSEPDEAIFVVLDFGQAAVPSEVDSICLGVWDLDPEGGQFGQRYALDSGDTATLAIDPGSAEGGRLLVHGYRGGQSVTVLQQDFDFSMDELSAPLTYCAPGRPDPATERDTLSVPAQSSMAVSQGPEGAWIVVASPGQSQVVAAGASGLETLPVPSPSTPGPATVTLALDADGDCDDDILVFEASSASLWRRDRGGLVLDNALLPAGASGAVDAAVFDADGDLFWDVAVVGPGGLEIWKGSGGGFSIAASGVAAAEVSDASALAVADLDGDGSQDLAVARQGQSDRLLYGSGTGTFTLEASALPEGDSDSRGIGIADIDGDGIAEVVVASLGAPVAAYSLDGARRYVDRSFLLLPNADDLDATGLILGDWNGDCEADVLIPASASQSWASERGALVVEDALAGAQQLLLEDLLATGERDALLLSATALRWWRR